MTAAPGGPGNNSVVPGHTVTFTLGSQKCVATTDLTGHASCTLVTPGGVVFSKVPLTARAGATRAYVAAGATGVVLVERAAAGHSVRPTTVPVHVNRPAPPPKPTGRGA
jgi:hypothetical protein